MEKKLNTTVEFEFCDGSKTELTLTFYKVYQLRNKNKAIYAKYNKIMANENPSDLELVELLYAAYVCAHLDEEDLLTEEEFIIMCGSDRTTVAESVKNLLNPKKK